MGLPVDEELQPLDQPVPEEMWELGRDSEWCMVPESDPDEDSPYCITPSESLETRLRRAFFHEGHHFADATISRDRQSTKIEELRPLTACCCGISVFILLLILRSQWLSCSGLHLCSSCFHNENRVR